jgi:alcohol dehydrogenase class IV
MDMTIHQFSFPTRIQSGPGAVNLVAGALQEAGKKRPLIVTDKGLAPLAPVTGTEKKLGDAGLEVTVFSGIWGNPVKSQVMAGVEAYRKHRADSIVGLGGGAALDVAKAILVMVNHPGDLFDYEDEKPGARPLDREIPYWVSIPTTAGTGSEVGRSSVVSDDETHVKKIIFSPRLLAARCFLDPELTVGLPAGVTAATGMDALTHLVESYLARGVHPLCDGVALAGMQIVAKSLEPAVEYARRVESGDSGVLADDGHEKARGEMLNAAMMGAVAFQKGLGVTHSLAHALSTVCDLHHGLANGVAIPYAMAFNAETEPGRTRLGELARLVRAEREDAAGFVAWLEALKARVGIPKTLGELGVKKEHVERLVEIAVADGCHANNPRTVSRADFTTLFSNALG